MVTLAVRAPLCSAHLFGEKWRRTPLAKSHAKTVFIAENPRVGAADLSVFVAAADGDIVQAPAKVFTACSFLDPSQGKLSKADRVFWTDIGQRRGKLRRQTAYVAVAVIGGVPYILDGAKRARAWKDGLSKAPEEIFVTVHQLLSISHAQKMAAAYQTSQKVERSAETIQAAYQKFSMQITSHRLSHGAIGNAIYLAFRGSNYEDEAHPTSAPINLTEAVGLIRKELKLLDGFGCPSRVFYSGILAMAIIALAVDPDFEEFISQIAEKRGNKVDGKMDPAESVLHLALITELMEPGRAPHTNPNSFGRALRGFDKWQTPSANPSAPSPRAF